MRNLEIGNLSRVFSLFAALALTAFAAIAIFQLESAKSVDAQETKSDLQQLIDRLNTDHILKGDQVTFRFAAPLDDGGLSELTVPGSQQEGTVDFFVLTEIGTDHVCISQKLGGLDSVNCIPYSNIADITYSYPPSS
ncbi:MAG: hypothetical protein ABI700_11130 [Chloroflexota bacterium]